MSSDRTLEQTVLDMTGVSAPRCYQCAKCSAGCPMAGESRLRPHDIMRLIQANRRDELLSSESLWLCLTCETCTARCPCSCDPARVIDALREIAWRDDLARPPRRVSAFHKSFLGQIRRHGRIFEMGLIAGYKMRSGALFSDVMSAPGMLGRGKLSLSPNRIEGLDEVRRIFAAAAASAPSSSDEQKPESAAADGTDPEPDEPKVAAATSNGTDSRGGKGAQES